MKKVLILANNAGGLYNFRFELICRLVKQGFAVYFAVPQPLQDRKVQLITDVGANYIQTYIDRRGTNPFEDIKLIIRYERIIKEVNPDVILTYTIKPNIYGNYIANKYNKPTIMNVTGIGSSFVSGSLMNIVKRMYKYACSKAKVIFFQNRYNLELFIKNNMVNSEKTILIPGSGVNIEKFKPVEQSNKDNIIRFLFIARIMKEKGIEEYLRVAENITNKYSNVEFQILGPFEDKRYKNILSENKNTRIKYLGISDDVRNEIREVDCIVHPTYSEGMSNVLLEAGAMGKPLIASNIPGCKEIIDNGVSGYLFKSRNVEQLQERIETFLTLDEDKRKEMGQSSRDKISKEFDRDIVIEEYMKVINKVVK